MNCCCFQPTRLPRKTSFPYLCRKPNIHKHMQTNIHEYVCVHSKCGDGVFHRFLEAFLMMASICFSCNECTNFRWRSSLRTRPPGHSGIHTLGICVLYSCIYVYTHIQSYASVHIYVYINTYICICIYTESERQRERERGRERERKRERERERKKKE